MSMVKNGGPALSLLSELQLIKGERYKIVQSIYWETVIERGADYFKFKSWIIQSKNGYKIIINNP